MRRVSLALVALGMAAVSPATIINFDEFGSAPSLFSNANPVTSEYSGLGVNFSSVNFLDGGAILDQASNFNVSAHSGNNFLAFNRASAVTMANGGHPLDPETVTFSTPASAAGIWASGAFSTGVFVMAAFDSSGTLLSNDVKVGAAGQWVHLSVTGSAISRVTLTEVGGDSTFVYDDLSFDPVPEPATLAVLGLGAAALLRRRRSR